MDPNARLKSQQRKKCEKKQTRTLKKENEENFLLDIKKWHAIIIKMHLANTIIFIPMNY